MNQKENTTNTIGSHVHTRREAELPADVVEVVDLLSDFGIWRTDAERLARCPHATIVWVKAAIEAAKYMPDLRNRPAILKGWIENPERIENTSEFQRRCDRIERVARAEQQAERLRAMVEVDSGEWAKRGRENQAIADRFRPTFDAMNTADQDSLVTAAVRDIETKYGVPGLSGFTDPQLPGGEYGAGFGPLVCDPLDSDDPFGVSLMATCSRLHEGRTRAVVCEAGGGAP